MIRVTVNGNGSLIKFKSCPWAIGYRLEGDHSYYLVGVGGAQIHVPVLLPGLLYQFEAEVQCIDHNGAADSIHVFICSANSSVPVLSAVVKMPLSELLES